MPDVKHSSLLPLVALVAFACAPSTGRDAATDSAASRTTSTRTAAPSAAPDSATSARWTVSADGIGPVHVGMTSAEARTALGLPVGARGGSGCSYLAGSAASPLHAWVMLTNDTVVRFDVRDSSIATTEGARVGDTEARVQQLYRGRVAVEPHKYVNGGHYLVVTPTGDGNHRLIFETDGRVVTTLHAGRRPEVANVEGCG